VAISILRGESELLHPIHPCVTGGPDPLSPIEPRPVPELFDFFFSFDNEAGLERAMACFEGEEAETAVKPMAGAGLWLAIVRKALPEASTLLVEWERWAGAIATDCDGAIIARERVSAERLDRPVPHSGVVAALMMLDEHNPVDAAEHLEPMLADDPDGRVASMLALAWIRCGEAERAVPLLQTLLDEGKGSFSRADCWNLLGEASMTLGRAAAAEQAFAEALRERPFHPGTLYNRAIQRGSIGDGEAALDLLAGAFLGNRFLRRKALRDPALETLRQDERFFELLGE
jgi:tetratricopeptide (TPR) repeat protein